MNFSTPAREHDAQQKINLESLKAHAKAKGFKPMGILDVIKKHTENVCKSYHKLGRTEVLVDHLLVDVYCEAWKEMIGRGAKKNIRRGKSACFSSVYRKYMSHLEKLENRREPEADKLPDIGAIEPEAMAPSASQPPVAGQEQIALDIEHTPDACVVPKRKGVEQMVADEPFYSRTEAVDFEERKAIWGRLFPGGPNRAFELDTDFTDEEIAKYVPETDYVKINHYLPAAGIIVYREGAKIIVSHHKRRAVPDVNNEDFLWVTMILVYQQIQGWLLGFWSAPAAQRPSLADSLRKNQMTVGRMFDERFPDIERRIKDLKEATRRVEEEERLAIERQEIKEEFTEELLAGIHRDGIENGFLQLCIRASAFKDEVLNSMEAQTHSFTIQEVTEIITRRIIPELAARVQPQLQTAIDWMWGEEMKTQSALAAE